MCNNEYNFENCLKNEKRKRKKKKSSFENGVHIAYILATVELASSFLYIYGCCYARIR